MIRIAIAAAAVLLVTAPAAAQSVTQVELQSRYDRALAAGYKALMLCSAIANAERNGATRTPESVMEWELTGIQQPLEGIVAELPFEITRDEAGFLYHVAVDWEEDMPPRLAHNRPNEGCSIFPIGFEMDDLPPPPAQAVTPVRPSRGGVTIQNPVPGLPISEAFDSTYGIDSRTTALIIAYPGSTFTYYADGFGPDVPQRTWSVAKSIAATLVGAASRRGTAEVSASAGLGTDENDPRRQITIDHLLRMASGRYSDTAGNRTDPLYFGGTTIGERAANWPLIHPPGTMFRYANNDSLMAVAAIEDTFSDYRPARLLDTLGMRHTVAETDWQGGYVLSSQVWATAPDLLRLGQLYLDDGMRGTQRILPEGWVEYVSDPSGPQPDGEWGYGAGWWTMRGMEGIPEDAFAARGNRGQYVVVIPSAEMVIVRRGEDPDGGSGFDIVQFTRDVLAALDQ